MSTDLPARERSDHYQTEGTGDRDHDIPLELLLVDAATALELVELHGLSRACRIANAILNGEPVLGESFVGDVVELMELAKAHAHQDNSDSRVNLISAIDRVETWGLDPERRMHNAVREIVASLETIRQVSVRAKVGEKYEAYLTDLATINAVAQRSLGVLGFSPHVPDVVPAEEPLCNRCGGTGKLVSPGVGAKTCPECGGRDRWAEHRAERTNGDDDATA